jgi:hypothetical protein
MKISSSSTQAVMRVGECGVRCVGFPRSFLAESLLRRPLGQRREAHAVLIPSVIKNFAYVFQS